MAQKFTVKKGLTKRLGLDGWVIYRDSLYGLYEREFRASVDPNMRIVVQA